MRAKKGATSGAGGSSAALTLLQTDSSIAPQKEDSQASAAALATVMLLKESKAFRRTMQVWIGETRDAAIYASDAHRPRAEFDQQMSLSVIVVLGWRDPCGFLCKRCASFTLQV